MSFWVLESKWIMIFVLSYVPFCAYMVSQLFCSIALTYWIAFGCLGVLLLWCPNICSDGFVRNREIIQIWVWNLIIKLPSPFREVWGMDLRTFFSVLSVTKCSDLGSDTFCKLSKLKRITLFETFYTFYLSSILFADQT